MVSGLKEKKGAGIRVFLPEEIFSRSLELLRYSLCWCHAENASIWLLNLPVTSAYRLKKSNWRSSPKAGDVSKAAAKLSVSAG